MKAKLVYESLQFQRSSDPRQVLNIGQRAQIEEWIKDVEWQKGYKIKYTIDDKLNVVVNQGLFLAGYNIDWLPDNLTVRGSLDLAVTKLSRLSNYLRVGGYLSLYGTSITELPNNLKIEGNLDIRGTKITTLPKDLEIGSSHIIRLSIEQYNIIKLQCDTIPRKLFRKLNPT